MNISLKALVTEMIHQPVQYVKMVHGGGNNRIYKVSLSSHNHVILKYYGYTGTDGLHLQREYKGLSFLKQQGELKIPAPIAIDQMHHCALYEWIEGEKLERIDPVDLEDVISFIDRLKHYSLAKGARKLLPASDHSLAISNIFHQIQRRLVRLKSMSQQEALHGFLENQYAHCYSLILNKIRNQTMVVLDKTLPFSLAVLSPSDFGFHNILKNQKGLIFIDFEYFGWEDPAAMLAHFLWHPGMLLSEAQKQYFSNEVFKIFARDTGFQSRFEILFPLIGLVWTLILLNEFIPAVWERRVQAGAVLPEEFQKKCDAQLQKAQNWIRYVRACV